MAYKTINLKESIPVSLLFCCYLHAKGQQSRTAVLPIQPPQWNRSLPARACPCSLVQPSPSHQPADGSAPVAAPQFRSHQAGLSWGALGMWAAFQMKQVEEHQPLCLQVFAPQSAAGGGWWSGWWPESVASLIIGTATCRGRMSMRSPLIHVFAFYFYALTNAWWQQRTTSSY